MFIWDGQGITPEVRPINGARKWKIPLDRMMKLPTCEVRYDNVLKGTKVQKSRISDWKVTDKLFPVIPDISYYRLKPEIPALNSEILPLLNF